MRNYVVSIVASGIVCAVSRSLISSKNATGKIVKLLTGILMTVTILSPVVNVSFSNISEYINGLSVDANAYCAEGQKVAGESMSGIIKYQTEAYILDKAKSMNLDIAVEVVLDDRNNSLPCGVTVNGNLSPYAREILSAYISDNLGIERENQRWI